LTWNPPESDGGADIFNYVVEYQAEGDKKWTKANKDNVKDTKYTVTGLKKGKLYKFRISAENKAGVGPASGPTELVKVEEPLGKSYLNKKKRP
jgi:titin